eukprot:GHVR01152856.1.p1 GENE.GHVR01152856.1~~GHVR01152856.1.p1  ORF type:complete len:301 (+),score=42.09 GHVR01152856.1:931-1833(+)
MTAVPVGSDAASSELADRDALAGDSSVELSPDKNQVCVIVGDQCEQHAGVDECLEDTGDQQLTLQKREENMRSMGQAWNAKHEDEIMSDGMQPSYFEKCKESLVSRDFQNEMTSIVKLEVDDPHVEQNSTTEGTQIQALDSWNGCSTSCKIGSGSPPVEESSEQPITLDGSPAVSAQQALVPVVSCASNRNSCDSTRKTESHPYVQQFGAQTQANIQEISGSLPVPLNLDYSHNANFENVCVNGSINLENNNESKLLALQDAFDGYSEVGGVGNRLENNTQDDQSAIFSVLGQLFNSQAF